MNPSGVMSLAKHIFVAEPRFYTAWVFKPRQKPSAIPLPNPPSPRTMHRNRLYGRTRVCALNKQGRSEQRPYAKIRNRYVCTGEACLALF